MSNHNNGLQDGYAYTIHLYDGRRIVYAVYHHCAASGRHYFVKGEKIYPIEKVFRHSMQGVAVREDMPPQVLTETYRGLRIEVTLTSVVPYNLISHIPEDILNNIEKGLKNNMTSGSFADDHTGDMVKPTDSSSEIYTTFSGSWRIVELSFKLISRIIRWWNDGHKAEEFNCALFARYFGKESGPEYYNRWVGHCKENLLDMFGTFLSDNEDGQKFCDMIMEQVVKYESRIKSDNDGQE